MRNEAEPWTDEPDRSVQHASHELPRVVGFPGPRPGEVEFVERHPARPLSDDQGDGALPEPDCAWARSTWLPRVMHAPWMSWAQAVQDTCIGQIP